jgi:hypothetical protein
MSEGINNHWSKAVFLHLFSKSLKLLGYFCFQWIILLPPKPFSITSVKGVNDEENTSPSPNCAYRLVNIPRILYSDT